MQSLTSIVPNANIAQMRIAIDARLTYYTSGGIARYIRNLIKYLPPLLDSNQQLIVQQSRKQRETLSPHPRAQRQTVWTPAHHSMERYALAAETLLKRPQIYHSPDFITPLGLGWKRIITIHDLAFLRYPEFMTAESQRYYNAQIQRSANEADAIIVNSEATKAETVAQLSIDPNKITVTHLAPAAEFSPASAAQIETVKQVHNIVGDYLLYVGTFEPRKNVPGLLSSYAIACNAQKNAPNLVLVGNTGWLFDDVTQQIEDLGIAHKVQFLSDISGADLPALYSGAKAFILISHYEGFGLPVLEAMACGTPVITSNIGALPEIAGEAALLVEKDDHAAVANSIDAILQDIKMADQLRVAGLKRAAEFSWQALAQKTLNTYLSV